MVEETNSVLFDQVEQLEEDTIVETRKARAASSGIADLVKTLKSGRKGPIDKGKKVKAGSTASEG